MDIKAIETFFMWCTVINGGLLIYTAIFCTFAPNWIYNVQSKWYPISREAFNVVIYSFLGIYKLFFITFNLVPYVALRVMG
jgi:hypothetical protein